MRRIFGMMPSECVEISKHYKDQSGVRILIEAGPLGWTIVWGDNSTTYVDRENSTESNFQAAYISAEKVVGPLTEV